MQDHLPQLREQDGLLGLVLNDADGLLAYKKTKNRLKDMSIPPARRQTRLRSAPPRLEKAPSNTRKLTRTLRQPKPIPLMHPSRMEKAGLQLAAFENRTDRMNRRSFLPALNSWEMDQRREQIRGMTPKQLREFVGKLNPDEYKIEQVHVRKGVPVNVNVRTNQTIRVQKRKGSPVKSITLTNYGKFTKLFSDPAGRPWQSMDAQHRERMVEYTLKTMDKYLSSSKHIVEEGPRMPARRLRVNEVRSRRLPTLENMIAQLGKRIESDSYVLREMKKEGNDPVMTQQMEKMLTGMKNRATILKGIFNGLKDGTYETIAKRAERKHARKQDTRAAREDIEKRNEAGGRAIAEEWTRRAREIKQLPQFTESTHERLKKQVLTPEQVSRATQNLNRILDELTQQTQARYREETLHELRKIVRRIIENNPEIDPRAAFAQAVQGAARQDRARRPSISLRTVFANEEEARRSKLTQNSERVVDLETSRFLPTRAPPPNRAEPQGVEVKKEPAYARRRKEWVRAWRRWISRRQRKEE